MAFKRHVIEVPLLLTFFALELLGPVGTNLTLYRTCYIILGYNETDCALLGNTENSTYNDLQKKVQPTVNVISTVSSIVTQVFGLIICLFAGQWSDKFGRKPILLVTQIGQFFSLLIMTLFSAIPYINPWYFMLSSIPSMLTGGFAAFLVTILSYISDISTDETRGMRMAMMEGMLGAGMLFGSLCSSYLYYATNYPSMYGIAAGIIGLNIIYIYFFLSESLENIEHEKSWKDIFKPSDLKGMAHVMTKPRENFNRAIILLMTVIMVLYIFISNGDGKTYLFLMGKFNWNLQHYTIFNSVTIIIFVIGTLGGTYLFKKLAVTESVVILLGLMCAFNGDLVRGLATEDFHIYFAAGLKFISGIISPQCRTLISKLVPVDEIAKVFALIMVVEFVVSIGASPFYTLIYNATVDTDPGFYNFVSAGLFGVDIIIILIIMLLEYKTTLPYEELNNEEPQITPESLIETF
ncbi:unnamed protein product [Diabrotica balteata]|uniref:Major facilitator superfamily (MFS) profile domain-containing protein n=1 Tax=Diabrotica balteata TaxID=107213 RepID=A0A9N9T1V9_DIABA|nr:unnamed protein product [Diabrotica balteata]